MKHDGTRNAMSPQGMRGQDCGHRHYENNQSNAYAARMRVVHEITRLKAPL